MLGRSFGMALLALLGACDAASTAPPGTWDVTGEPAACTSADTGAATNDDPGIPRVLDLRWAGEALVTLDDGVVLAGTWFVNDGDPSLPANAPGRQPSIDIDVPEYEHAGATWANLGLRLEAQNGDLSVVQGTWQAFSSHTTSVVHSMCLTTLVATRR